MGWCLKITAVLFLLVQVFHLVFLQTSTNSPRRTMDPSYLRQHPQKTHMTQNTEEMEYEQVSELSNEYSGIASGSMAILTEEEESVSDQDNKTGVTTTVAPTFITNVTTNQTASTSAVTTVSANLTEINTTETRVESQNMTTATTTQNSTSLSSQNSTNQPLISNHTDLQTTTLVPESNTTQEPTTNATESTNTTTVTASTTTDTATTKQQLNETSATSSTTTASSSETTSTNPETTSLETTRETTTDTTTETTTIPALLTPEQANKTDKGSASGSSSERGSATESYHNKGHNTWGAVLGTAIAVVCLGVVAYIILKKKHQKNFSHRKLVEEFPSDPVLRLDNSAPLDLNFGGGSLAFYNPGLQGDNIQMSNFPGRR